MLERVPKPSNDWRRGSVHNQSCPPRERWGNRQINLIFKQSGSDFSRSDFSRSLRNLQPKQFQSNVFTSSNALFGRSMNNSGRGAPHMDRSAPGLRAPQTINEKYHPPHHHDMLQQKSQTNFVSPKSLNPVCWGCEQNGLPCNHHHKNCAFNQLLVRSWWEAYGNSPPRYLSKKDGASSSPMLWSFHRRVTGPELNRVNVN